MVGKQSQPVNILQYADDTVFVWHASWDNVIVLKPMLRGFELWEKRGGDGEEGKTYHG